MPEVSTSTTQPRELSAATRGPKSADSRGSPPVARMSLHLGEQPVEGDLAPPGGVPGVLGVTPFAAHRAALEPGEDRRHPGGRALALYRVEDFRDASRHGSTKEGSTRDRQHPLAAMRVLLL